MWKNPSRGATTGWWKSPYEAAFRQGVRAHPRVVERHGWTLLRVKGSHHIYGKPESVVRLSVPIHGNKPLKEGLLNHLAKLAGIGKDDLV